MHTLRASTLPGLILSYRNFTRWFVRQLSPKQCVNCLNFLSIEFYWFYCEKQFFGTLKSPKLKYLENHPLKKIPAQRFEDHIRTNKLEEFFFSKNVFFKDLELFSRFQNHWFGRHFFPQKNNFVVFFKCDYLIKYKHVLQKFIRKIVNCWFYSFK